MSKHSGDIYICDRCGRKDFVEERLTRIVTEPGEKEPPKYTPILVGWHKNPFATGECEEILCPDCYSALSELVERFMEKGGAADGRPDQA